MRKSGFAISILIQLFVVIYSFGQSDTLLQKIKGEWYIEKMNMDTIILNKDQVLIESSDESYRIIIIKIYDESVNKTEEIIGDRITYEESLSRTPSLHFISGNKIKFNFFFDQSNYYKICDSQSDRIVLCKYVFKNPFLSY